MAFGTYRLTDDPITTVFDDNRQRFRLVLKRLGLRRRYKRRASRLSNLHLRFDGRATEALPVLQGAVGRQAPLRCPDCG